MAQKMRDNRQSNNTESRLSRQIQEFMDFAKRPKYHNYSEEALKDIFQQLIWMSEVDRKLYNKTQENKLRQSEQNKKTASKEIEYPKWSQDPKSIKIKEPSLEKRLWILAGFIIFVLAIVFIILGLTLWAPKVN
ncbi:hypothetical protein [[Mycoplasma] gypis]|uniref:Uncharacterized protein n=1 Tax=[Mycoplasma] gypis TaxID=92404 RepID=A0ABZ2RP13_9BACT|nr:hypothetical protein [[Mycoplasma] gypis]MBN0919090.1 hypothetical protein [[Mycoplasma] gypis]